MKKTKFEERLELLGILINSYFSTKALIESIEKTIDKGLEVPKGLLTMHKENLIKIEEQLKIYMK